MQKIGSIELLRFPLAVLVVMEHTLPHYTVNGTQFIAYLIFDTFLRDNSVPVFFFISGFLLFYNTDKWNIGVWCNKIKRRIHTLFIPYIIWNVYAILFLWVTMSCGMTAYMANGADFTPSIRNITNCFWKYDGALANVYLPSIFPINISTWYVRDLIIMCLISPIIYWILKKFPTLTIITVSIIWFLTKEYTALFFFTVGAYYSIHKRSLPILSLKCITTVIIVYILSASIVCIYPKILEQCKFQYFKEINIITFLFLAFHISGKIKNTSNTTFISGASVFLFLSHQPICGKINNIIIFILQPQSIEYITIINLLAITITVASILYIYYLLLKYMPNTLYVLTGRKNNNY